MTQAQEDRRFREALEARSINERRADVVTALNKVSSLDAARSLPGAAVLLLLREARQGHERHVLQLNKAHDRGGFDRLHPASELRRAAAEQVRDAPGSMNSDAQTRSDYLPDHLSIEEMQSMVQAMAARRFY